MYNLNHIHLTNNDLTALPPLLLKNQISLRSVYLEGNLIATLPSGLFAHATSLKKVCLKLLLA